MVALGPPKQRSVPDMGPFVSHDWWRANVADVALVHVGPPRSTRDIPTLDLDHDLSAPATDIDGRHPLPTPQHFADALARAGLGDDDPVVAVDDAGGVLAARLVWMLRATGRDAALLDGGSLDDDVVSPRPRTGSGPSVVPWTVDLLVGPDDVLTQGRIILDARPRDRYLGAADPLDPRPGHLPGAVSLPCRENLAADGRLLPDDVLRRRLAGLGDDGSVPVVSACGSGVTACHTLLIREHLGLPTGLLYPGSWSQWASDPDRPVEL